MRLDKCDIGQDSNNLSKRIDPRLIRQFELYQPMRGLLLKSGPESHEKFQAKTSSLKNHHIQF